jgi:hypothetical protein
LLFFAANYQPSRSRFDGIPEPSRFGERKNSEAPAIPALFSTVFARNGRNRESGIAARKSLNTLR